MQLCVIELTTIHIKRPDRLQSAMHDQYNSSSRNMWLSRGQGGGEQGGHCNRNNGTEYARHASDTLPRDCTFPHLKALDCIY